jgi:toxin ParE1/3/4
MRIDWSELAIYKLYDESILVLAVIHAARDLNNIKPQPWEDA